MQRSTFAVLLTPLFALSLSATAMAAGYTGPNGATTGGYTGPNAQVTVKTVAQALSAGDDTPVVLEGHVVKRLQDELYEFKDASGTINVEIDDEHWPAQAISDTVKVRIHGEVDRDLMSREIDAEYIELVR